MIYLHFKWGGGYSKSEVDTLLNGKADSSHTHSKSQITDFPSYGTTANTICEGNDSRLSDARTPTSHTHTKSEITDFPTLATVATSGSYNDLSNKPTIPTVNNATLKIQKNGTDVKTFTANASSDVTCNITVPTKVSDLTNDSGFLTSHQSLSNYSTLANTIKSLSISGKTITYTKGDDTTGTLTTQDNNTWTAMVGATSSSNGSVGYVNAVPPKDGYNTKYLRADGTWQVPPDHTYNVYNKTLTIQKNGTNVATFTSNSNTDVTANISVPTKTSDLTNDSGFLTSHQDLSGYVPRSGGAVITGTNIGRVDNTGSLDICGGTSWNNGASIALVGKDVSNNSGRVIIKAEDATSYNQLSLFPSGNIIVDVKNGTQKNLAMQEDVIPRSGGAVMTGISLAHANAREAQHYCGGTSTNTGGHFTAFGKDHNTSGGWAAMRANNGTEDCAVNLHPDGTMTKTKGSSTKNFAMQEDVIPRSGGAVFTGDALSRIDDTTFLAIRGGSGYNKGAQLTLYGKDAPSGYEGYAYLMASDGTNISQFALRPDSHATILCRSFRPLTGNPTLGDASYLWGQIYSTNSTISTSDSRLKNTITDIDDSLLDAWESIQPKQYKFNDATETKGDSARFHTGYIAQDIQKACTDNNIDATRYGLFCFDSWDEQPEVTEDVEVEKDGVKTTETRIVQEKRAKGDSYSLRYEEALVVECAYLRRENTRLKTRLDTLENRLEQLEQSFK